MDMLFGDDDDSADAAIEASQIEADYQQQALDYLREQDRIPSGYREGALAQVGQSLGITLDEAGQPIQDESTRVGRARADPLYQAIIGGREAGEESIARYHSMTGGLRSGNIESAFYDYNTQLENRALLQSYDRQTQDLQGLMGQPSLAPAIAQTQAGIGQTLGQGIIGAEQSRQAGSQQGFGNMMGMANLGMQAYSTFSDKRLKTNIKPKGKRNGHNWYEWDWNETANSIGLKGHADGVIADEIEEYLPEAVSIHENGFKQVDMRQLGV